MFNDPSMLKTQGQVSKANVFKTSGGKIGQLGKTSQNYRI